MQKKNRLRFLKLIEYSAVRGTTKKRVGNYNLIKTHTEVLVERIFLLLWCGMGAFAIKFLGIKDFFWTCIAMAIIFFSFFFIPGLQKLFKVDYDIEAEYLKLNNSQRINYAILGYTIAVFSGIVMFIFMIIAFGKKTS